MINMKRVEDRVVDYYSFETEPFRWAHTGVQPEAIFSTCTRETVTLDRNIWAGTMRAEILAYLQSGCPEHQIPLHYPRLADLNRMSPEYRQLMSNLNHHFHHALRTGPELANTVWINQANHDLLEHMFYEFLTLIPDFRVIIDEGLGDESLLYHRSAERGPQFFHYQDWYALGCIGSLNSQVTKIYWNLDGQASRRKKLGRILR